MSKIILPDSFSSNSSSSASSQYFRPNNNTSQSPQNPTTDSAIIYDLCKKVAALEKENKTFRKHISKEASFYKSITRLSNVAIVFLLALPVVQLLIVAVLIYFLRDDSSFINLLKGGFAIIGIATIFEMLYIPKKIHDIEKKVEKLEEKSNQPLAEVMTYQE